jgi:hypothetical protein
MFGFIITRHVSTEIAAKYWVECVSRLRHFYPENPIVIIDDASLPNLIAPLQVENVTVVQSEFPKRGELLPYYYLLKYKWFEKAVILHDSVFLQTWVNFDAYADQPLWCFYDNTDLVGVKSLVPYLKNSSEAMTRVRPQMRGCFGLMAVVQVATVQQWQEEYNFLELLKVVKSRPHRCSLERVFGLFFSKPSIFGNIFRYQYGLNYADYKRGRNRCKFIVKVWTGR